MIKYYKCTKIISKKIKIYLKKKRYKQIIKEMGNQNYKKSGKKNYNLLLISIPATNHAVWIRLRQAPVRLRRIIFHPCFTRYHRVQEIQRGHAHCWGKQDGNTAYHKYSHQILLSCDYILSIGLIFYRLCHAFESRR